MFIRNPSSFSVYLHRSYEWMQDPSLFNKVMKNIWTEELQPKNVVYFHVLLFAGRLLKIKSKIQSFTVTTSWGPTQQPHFIVAWNEGSKKLRPLWRQHLCVAGKRRCHGCSSCSCSYSHPGGRKLYRPARGSLTLSGLTSCYVSLKLSLRQGKSKGAGEMEKLGRRGDEGEMKVRKVRGELGAEHCFVRTHSEVWMPSSQKQDCCMNHSFRSSALRL